MIQINRGNSLTKTFSRTHLPVTNLSLINIFLGNRSDFFPSSSTCSCILTDRRLGSEYAAGHRHKHIMSTQHSKSLYAILRIQIIKNPEDFMTCHYQYNNVVDISPTVTMV